MEEPREKLTQKSNNITETPMRGQTAAITTNMKNSKKEQDPPKKSRNMRKKGLLEFFGEGPRVPTPSTEGTMIKAVKKQRDKRANRDTGTKKRESSELDKSTHRKTKDQMMMTQKNTK